MVDIKEIIQCEEQALGSDVQELAGKTATIAFILRRDAERYGVDLDTGSSYIAAAVIQNTAVQKPKG